MAKSLSQAGYDALLDLLATCTIMVACSAQPTTYTELTSTYALADVTLSGGDFTKATGDGGSPARKVTVGAKTGVTIDSSGTATHVGHGISGSSTLVWVTTCTSQALTSGNTVNFPAHKHEVSAIA